MSVFYLKEQLHLAIDSIEDEEFLEALLTITHTQHSAIEVQSSEEELKILKEKRSGIPKWQNKSQTLERNSGRN